MEKRGKEKGGGGWLVVGLLFLTRLPRACHGLSTRQKLTDHHSERKARAHPASHHHTLAPGPDGIRLALGSAGCSADCSADCRLQVAGCRFCITGPISERRFFGAVLLTEVLGFGGSIMARVKYTFG
ncbi:hypothetical protein BD289DRAFT_103203 [Coniella lustricola]|uniref:Secreted protein n=1 Tax=Coniella lustricola TaxID=2025994 RepID=A0A2T2ZY27_9PEZI|nr:hypothetical protein BD289DRAFT_103203 [Coniella lustricola]